MITTYFTELFLDNLVVPLPVKFQPNYLLLKLKLQYGSLAFIASLFRVTEED